MTSNSSRPRIAMLIGHNLAGDSRVNKTYEIARSYASESELFRYPINLNTNSNNFSSRARAIIRTTSIQIATIRFLEKVLPSFMFEQIKQARRTHHLKRLEVISKSFLARLRAFQPEIVYAHDADTLKAAVQYKNESGCKVVYDAHEYLRGLSRPDPGWQPAMLWAESNIDQADIVITVSDQIAELLRNDYALAELPRVVLNAPPGAQLPNKREIETFRQQSGIPSHVPFHVYVGSANETRGLSTMVESLKHVDSHHIGFVINNLQFRRNLLSLARKFGASERVHFSNYVDSDLVTSFISDATSGISPVLRRPNHELSCFTKFYEYAQAGLPIITSDVKVMAQTVRDNQIGEVFRAGDAQDLANCMQKVVEKNEYYRVGIVPELLKQWSWEDQIPIVLEVFEEATFQNPRGIDRD